MIQTPLKQKSENKKQFPFERQEIDWEQERRRQAFDGNSSESEREGQKNRKQKEWEKTF